MFRNLDTSYFDTITTVAKNSGFHLDIEIYSSPFERDRLDLILTNGKSRIRESVFCDHSNGSHRNNDDIQVDVARTFNEMMARLGTAVIKAKAAANNAYGTLKIKRVIFNGPATIVFWSDGTKTVVKARNNEPVDHEKGLAMAISKKVFGNHYKYYNIFKKFLPKDEEVANG